MTRLDINMVVKANNEREADKLATSALMGLGKNIAMVHGMACGCGNGNCALIAAGKYSVTAEMQLETTADNINKVIHATQVEWNDNPNIISSVILATEERHEPEPEPELYECEACGDYLEEDEVTEINPETTNKYYLCDECLDEAMDNGDVSFCEKCEQYISADEAIPNPVNRKMYLCPYCGSNLE